MRNFLVFVISTFAAAAAAAEDRLDFSLFAAIDPIAEHASVPLPTDGECLLLQFWASWCHSCGGLMWDMDALARANDGVKYLAVSLDDEPSAARDYIRGHRLFEKHRDSFFVDAGKSLSKAMDVVTVPSVFVVDSGGTVLIRKSGHLNSRDLQEITDAIRSTR